MKKVALICLISLNIVLVYSQTISDGSAIWEMTNITGTGCRSNADFNAGNGINQLFAVDWYIGIGEGLSQNFPPPSNFTTTDTSIIAQYIDLLEVRGLAAELTIIITEFEPLDVQVAQIMQIKNNTGTQLDIRLFNYLDLDKNNATIENATLFLEDDCNLITEVSNVDDPSQLCYYAVNASDGYEILPYPQLCTNLVNGISNLNNAGLPLLANDYTQALQFNATLPNGGINTGETLLTFGRPPEPATIDVNSGQCSFESTPPPEFTIGQPIETCNDDGSFTLVLAFSGEADGTEYTFTETNTTGINTVSFMDTGTIDEIVLGTYPIGASWNIEVMSSFQEDLLNTFSGTGICSPTSSDCTGDLSNPFPTPQLMATCEEGFNMVLAIDESGSIRSAQAEKMVADAVLAFLKGMMCFGQVNIALIEFSGEANYIIQDYILLNPDVISNIENYFNPSIGFNGTYQPFGKTNWESAFQLVDNLPPPELLLFFTDGDPSSNQEGIELANKIKCEGTHIFMTGVGNITDTQNLVNVSGSVLFNPNLTPDDEIPASQVCTSDYTIGDNLNNLDQILESIASNLCPPCRPIECIDDLSDTGIISNPELMANCEEGFNMALVIDESGSIWNAQADKMVADAVLAFLNGLICFESVNISLIEFSSGAQYIIQDYTALTNGLITNIENYFNPSLGFNGTYKPFGSTNWESAFQLIDDLPPPDLLLFFTDGDPSPDKAGIQIANNIKCEGTHIFMTGVGNITDTQNLMDVSGPVQFDPNLTPNPDIVGSKVCSSDFTFGDDLNNLVQILESIANNLCPPCEEEELECIGAQPVMTKRTNLERYIDHLDVLKNFKNKNRNSEKIVPSSPEKN